MYVLIHKNRVVVGPMGWNRAMFDAALKRAKITQTLPRVAPEQLPLVIDQDTKIMQASLVYQEYNSKIEYLHGPFWDLTGDQAIGTFEIKETPVEQIKAKLIQDAAAARYDKEIAGVKATIQGLEVTVDTNRGSRDVFVQQFLLMGENDVSSWKFPEGWLSLSKQDLGLAVAAGVAHVQAAFDWERSKIEEINAATTPAQLDAVVIVEAQPEIAPE